MFSTGVGYPVEDEEEDDLGWLFMRSEFKKRPDLWFFFQQQCAALSRRFPPAQAEAVLSAAMTTRGVQMSSQDAGLLRAHLIAVFGDMVLGHDDAADEPRHPLVSGEPVDIFPPEKCPLDTGGSTKHVVRVVPQRAALKVPPRYFTMSGVYSARVHVAVCTCGVRLRASMYMDTTGAYAYYKDAVDRPYFQATRDTIFARSLLAWQATLLEGGVGFEPVEKAYARMLEECGLPGAGQATGLLRPFDYRQIEMGFLKHELLLAEREAGLPLSKPLHLTGPDALERELLRVQRPLEVAFTTKWVSNHSAVCPKGGRCKCLTFDLDAKVNRDVCCCRAGGKLVLPGHGVIQVGCRDSPSFLSPLCAAHTRRAAIVTSCLPERFQGKESAPNGKRKQR